MEVAPPQPARLLGEAEGPLEAEALEAVGRLALEAGVEVEGGADADQHGASSRSRIAAIHFSCSGTPRPTQMTSAPEALSSAAIAVASSSSSSRNGRGADAGDLQAGVAARQLVAQPLERLLAAAVEEEARAGARGALAGVLHQVGPVDAAREVVAEQVHRPHERLAVGDGEVRRRARRARSSGSSWKAITVCTAATQM